MLSYINRNGFARGIILLANYFVIYNYEPYMLYMVISQTIYIISPKPILTLSPYEYKPI